jgi:TolB-like protein/Tfp pilus assembly protein PilF
MDGKFARPPSVDAEAATVESVSTIRAQLQRILGSPPFLNARRPSEFLRFIVESTLSGQGNQIKEYLIGVEVFRRPPGYDPKADPVVRIEAGRLRKKLAEYYSRSGADDRIVIELPKGGYVPVFRPAPLRTRAEENTPQIVSSVAGKRTWAVRASAAALLLFTTGILAASYVQLHRQRTARPTSIAVLPFLDLPSGEASNAHVTQYLSDGVTEDLTTGLAQLKGLRVVAATSAFQFRGKPEDARKVGQSLAAEALLEGSIARSGSGFRINAQLVDTRNGYHLWSKAYDVGARDLLACEQDILQATAHVLWVPSSGPLPLKRDTDSAEAHDLYLQARYLWHTRQVLDMLESVRLFEQAIHRDPNYALAFAGLADSYVVMAINTQMSPAEALPRAKAAIQRALELDPSLARVHATLGLLKSQCEWDWHGGEQEFREAIELDPNYAPAHHWAGLDYMLTGQFADADAELRQAQVLDPLSPMISEGLAENFYNARRYDDAISTVRNMPNGKVGWVILANSYIEKGMYEEALKIPQVANGEDMNGLIVKAAALARSGDRDAAFKTLQDLESNTRRLPGVSPHDYMPPGFLGSAYARIGEKERAFAWLEKAYKQHDPALANLKVDPSLDSLRSDPRYLDLLKKLGLSS